MPVGPGRYDDLATYVREQAGARAVVVIVIGEDEDSSGFSVQVSSGMVLRLPQLLRKVAAEIEGLPQ